MPIATGCRWTSRQQERKAKDMDMKCPDCGGVVYEGLVAGTVVWACDDCGWCLAGAEVEHATVDEATGTVIPGPEGPARHLAGPEPSE